MKHKLLAVFSFLSIGFIFTGCLKDDNYEDMVYGQKGVGSEKIIEIAAPPSSPRTLNSSLIGSSKDTTFAAVTVNLASPEPAQEDIKVTLALKPSLVTDYNTATGSSFQIPPSSIYSLDPLTVTIPKGKRMADVNIKLKPNDFLTTPYALGFTIVSVESAGYVISANFKDFVRTIGVRNVWDGIYSVEAGNVQRYSAPGVPTTDALNGSVAGNPDMTLSTVGPTTVELTNLQWANKGGGVGGIANLRLSVDPATNEVTMFALGNATLTNWTGKLNKYDPATKTFTLNFRWNPATTTREYSIVLKYKGPRP